MKLKTKVLAAALICTGSVGAQAATFMDAAWASQLCKAWNSDAGLTKGLGGDAWAKNDAGRGYKVIQLYRTKCGEKSAVELEIANKDGKAVCNYGGAVKHPKLNLDFDYVMNATDEDWACMGEGKFGCGAMGAMMSGKLKFKGPKGEAMGVWAPSTASCNSPARSRATRPPAPRLGPVTAGALPRRPPRSAPSPPALSTPFDATDATVAPMQQLATTALLSFSFLSIDDYHQGINIVVTCRDFTTTDKMTRARSRSGTTLGGTS